MGFFRTHKTFFVSIAFIVAFSITVSYATPPSSPYTAGSTLDPACAPGSSNCTVAAGGSGAAVWGSITGTISSQSDLATALSGKEVPLTFSTGLTRTVNSIAVNPSQNISTLSNLTSNGLIRTSGGTGALSIATAGTDYTTPAGAESLTNKTISGASNTLSNIGNAALTNSSLTLAAGASGSDVNWGTSTVSLGGTATLNIPDAGASSRGLLTTGAQTLAGAKTFTGGIVVSAGGLSSSGTITLSGFTTNGGLLYSNGSGVLFQTGAGTSTGVLHGGTTPGYGAVVLTTDVSGILPVANGGTGSATAPYVTDATNGTLTRSGTGPYTLGLNLGNANTWTGQQTFGTSAPIFSTTTLGSVYFAGTGGVLSQDNGNLFYNATNHQLGELSRKPCWSKQTKAFDNSNAFVCF